MTKINIILGDITKNTDIEGIDAIVNVTDKEVSGRGGKVDNAIHKAAGEALSIECKKLGVCEAGEVKITDAYNLNCKKIFHIVDLKSEDTKAGEKDLLKKSYYNCLMLAMKEGIKTIAFPSIRTKKYDISSSSAAEIAIRTIKEFVKENPEAFDEIRFVLFDDKIKSKYDKMDAKGDKIFRNMEVSVDLQISDYKHFIDAIMNLIKGSKEENESDEELFDEMDDEETKNDNLIDVIVDTAVDGSLKLAEVLLNYPIVKRLLRKEIEKKLSSKLAMKSIKVKKLNYEKREKGDLSVCIEISEYDYAEIFDFFSKTLKKNIGKIANPAFGVVEEVLSDDLKDELVIKIVNASSEGICELATNEINNKSDMGISLSNLQCKSGY